MKRNYLVRTYWERLYFEEYSQELDDLLLQYFQFKIYNGRQSNTLTYGKQYKSIEYFLYALEVYKETNKNAPNVLGIENRGINLHLDHIIPICSAKTDEDVYKLNHWSNFQPLCSKINRNIKWKN